MMYAARPSARINCAEQRTAQMMHISCNVKAYVHELLVAVEGGAL